MSIVAETVQTDGEEDSLSPVPSSVHSEDDETEPIDLENAVDNAGLAAAYAGTADHEALIAAFSAAVAAADQHTIRCPPAANVARPPRARTAPKASATPASAARKLTRKPSGVGAKRGGGAPANGEPVGTFSADLRCAVRVGREVWTAERDGCLVVRCAQSGTMLERVVSGYEWDMILSLLPVAPNAVWCGTEAGPIVVLDRYTRKPLFEARQHSGGVHALASSPEASRVPFVVSGSSDWRLNMWTLEGKLIKTYAGHRGAVRCVLIVSAMEIWTGSDDATVRVWHPSCGLACSPQPRLHIRGLTS